MNDRHVTETLPALLAGELEATRAEAVERHLAGCGECRRERDRLALLLTTLDGAARRPRAGESVWPAVRARTVGRRDQPVFGGSVLARLAGSAAAVAAGILLSLTLPDAATVGETAVIGDDGRLAGLWLEDLAADTWTGTDLTSVWLDTAADDEGGES